MARVLAEGLLVKEDSNLVSSPMQLAKTQFMQKQEPLDASLLYMAMKKKSLVKGLFK